MSLLLSVVQRSSTPSRPGYCSRRTNLRPTARRTTTRTRSRMTPGGGEEGPPRGDLSPRDIISQMRP